jgi:hypothetical protein
MKWHGKIQKQAGKKASKNLQVDAWQIGIILSICGLFLVIS